jgi:molybdenum cofactor biosynthesis enzyme MoaA
MDIQQAKQCFQEAVALNVTEKCNWKCHYCIADTHNAPKRSFEDVMKDAENISDDVYEVVFS